MFRASAAVLLASAALVSAFSGDGTYYAAGLGACGITNSDTDMIAAISSTYFDSYPGATGNPNENPICGKQIRATYGSASVVVAITDRCAGCAGGHDIDFTPSAFAQIADQGLGRIQITWEFVDGSGAGSGASSSAAAETTAAAEPTTAAAEPSTAAAEPTTKAAEPTTASPAETSSEAAPTLQGNAAVTSASSSASATASKTCNRGSRRRRARRSHRAARHLAEDSH